MDHYRKYLEDGSSVSEQGTHTVYWTTAECFRMIPVNRWKFNRPPDPERIAEIREWISTSKRVDGIIYLARVNGELVCYESNHRREAMKGIDGLYSIFVDVMWDVSDDIVKEEFLRLNKAVSVPELYVDNTAEESVTKVLDVINAFCNKYPKLKSTSARPNRPGYNRDTFTQDFVRVMKELNIGAEELLSRLERLNAEMSTRSRKKLSATCGHKCEASGLWLFAWSPVLNAKELE